MAVTAEHLWEAAITHLHDLSNATLQENTQLQARVAELQAELVALKMAYSAATDIAALDKKAHNAQLSSLNRQMSAFGRPQVQDPLVFCVIDGDRLLFSRSLIEQGYQGGRTAAQTLTKAIAQDLVEQGLTGFERLSFWATIYLNKHAVHMMLRQEGFVSPDQFEAFLLGFGQASPRFVVMDSGPGRESTEMKVMEYVKTFIRCPQTMRVFLGGIDGAYVPVYNSLEQEGFACKLVLVQQSSDISIDVRQQMPARSLRISDLFANERHSPIPTRRPGPLIGLSEPVLNSHVITNGGLISPQSESQGSMTTPPPANGHRSPDSLRQIDPTKPLHKQVPPPCNEHYLMSCSKGLNCKYSHEWILSADQLDVLARNAKKAPCNYLKNGLVCPYGDRCCWGHICPSGSRCFHLSKGKCWFKGDGMHVDAA